MSKCKVCRAPFVKRSMTHKACSPVCAQALAKLEREKKASRIANKARQETRARLMELKPKSYWMHRAQAAFNAFIRFRDRNQTCICCGEALGKDRVGGGYDAGHYRSTGAASHLRFDEDNCHAQRKHCNRHLGGRYADYRVGLIGRLGIGRVEALEAANEVRKWTVPEYKEVEKHYKAKLKESQLQESV